MNTPRARALLLDLDGTLLDSNGVVRPRVRDALRELDKTDVHVMVVTGRSAISARPILENLGLEGPAVIFNGAGIIDPRRGKWLEERVLSNRTMVKALEFTASKAYQSVVMTGGAKFATRPRDEEEARTLVGLHQLALVDFEDLPCENVIRVTWFSRDHVDSAAFAAELEGTFDDPLYVTHFPLNVLAEHRASPVQMLDIHPPCRGKAEAVRFLEERFGISAAEMVAVGDANNDLPMLTAAGLGVAMASGMPEAIAAADRVIGGNDTDAIADLVGELFAVSV
jgi:Cof subfamily protein (haloacid dehalogenase superfamily)